jgi:hypothetical protein
MALPQFFRPLNLLMGFPTQKSRTGNQDCRANYFALKSELAFAHFRRSPRLRFRQFQFSP